MYTESNVITTANGVVFTEGSNSCDGVRIFMSADQRYAIIFDPDAAVCIGRGWFWQEFESNVFFGGGKIDKFFLTAYTRNDRFGRYSASMFETEYEASADFGQCVH